MCSNVPTIRKRRVPVTLLLVITCLLPVTSSLPLSQFFPFNTTYGDQSTKATDDGGSGKIQLNISFPFFNKSHNKLFVNNNGVISFLKELKTYKPEDFPLQNETPIVAPFWADVDVTIGGTVYYRESEDPVILAKATNEITQYFHSLRRFKAAWVFIATWDNVGFYGATDKTGKSKRNTFQAVLITDSVRSFVIFNYNKIEWTTGSNSGGSTNTGLGGNPAQAGFNAGDKKTYREIPGARNHSVVNLTLTTNVGQPGKWVFQVDSETIVGRCSESGSGELYVTRSSGSMLGGEEIQISGPCFSDSDTPVAKFDDLNVTFPCTVDSRTGSAVCVTPTVFRTGSLRLSISVANSHWNFTGHFTTVNVAEVKPQVQRHNPEQWIVGSNNNLQISWDPSLLESTQVTVEVLGYELVDEMPHFVPVATLKVSNNGKVSFIMPKMPQSVSSAICKVSTSSNNGESLSRALWSDVFPVRRSDNLFSNNWCVAWMKQDRLQTPLNRSEPCPCVFEQAESDTSRYQADPLCRYGDTSFLNCIYRAQTKKCLMLNYQKKDFSSQVCCYDSDNELLDARSSTGGGTVDRYHYKSQGENVTAFFTYYEQDVLPHLHCCTYSTERQLCVEFLKLRQPTTCEGYSPPAVAQAAGDPHLVTLDGKSFTFNGEGEFVLIEDVNGSVIVQVRAERATDPQGQRQNATVFTAIAMQITNVSDVFEIQMDTETVVKILVNSEELLEPTSDLNGLKITLKQTGNSTAEVNVVMETVGMSFLIQVTQYLINIMPTVGSAALKGNLRGLLGNYNGDPSDEFTARNGTVISPDSSMSDIHFLFGMTWAVPPTDRLFTQSGRGNVEDSENSTFVPDFLDAFNVTMLRNGTREVCGDNIQCTFDYQVTGNADIADSTKKFTKLYNERINSIKLVIRCPYIPEIENGNRTVSGRTEGSVAEFVCDPGFDLLGESQLVCVDNNGEGRWSSSLPVCGKRVSPPPQTTLSMELMIAIGSGAVLVVSFIGILIIVLVRSRRRRHVKLKSQVDEGSIGEIELPTIFPTTNIPGPVFENPLFINSLQKLGDGGSYRIPRPTYVDPSIFSEFF
ncbi:sushi domain-containing protein 2-like [Gigantopelta aegis]|uniref:sushi domain-containing protein 2-like n=1 Tax=Gigantopelta aegis TaxID=1735272 RepID=UPI001B88B34D|nr:sushi domain-containing protein 2-like [Gigantopelta aegis]